MTKQERYRFFTDYFLQHAPDAETELIYDDPFQLLVAVILSAQCTDKRVNLTTPHIFAKFPDAVSLSNAKFDGKVPMTVDELVQLPGVGRKTANVITSVIDNQPNMAVDTHVFRVSARIGLTSNAKTPLAAEKQLIKHIPAPYVHIAHHWLILHGRYICTARKPRCSECGLHSICKFVSKKTKS